MTNTPDDFSLIRVLLVDDQAHVRTWVRNVLEMLGISEIAEAKSGREALAAVTQPGGAGFDLILCDLQMPGQDGIETIRELGLLGMETAIAIMSVEEARVIETAGMLAGVQGLRMLGTIQKPVTAEKLQPILKRLGEVSVQATDTGVVVPREDFADAFGRKELFFLYHPKIWMRTGKFAGAEALVRWRHPRLGLLQPASFVREMEADAQYGEMLTELALREAIGCAGRWRESGRDLPVAVNLSARDFDRLDLPERIEALAKEAQVSPALVTLEVREAQVTGGPTRMMDVATRLRLKGFQLAIDDFGTGHSTLSTLQTLPFNELKLNRSIVHGCATSATQRSVVEASLALAHNLRMTSSAEGIQDRPDWELLTELGCEMMHGFFIARPMSEEGLEAWAVQWMLK